MQTVILTRRELYDLVWTEPMSKLAKRYKISDVGLRKICTRLAVPIPQAGYWAKLKAGKKVPQRPFQETLSGEQKVSLQLRGEEEPEHPSTNSKQIQEQLLAEPKLNFSVPERLSSPHPFIIAAKNDLAFKRADWKFEGVIRTEGRVLNIRVSPANVGRALRFLDTLLKLLLARGHGVEVTDSGTFVLLKGERIQISLREKSHKQIAKGPYYDSTKYVANGLLFLQAERPVHSAWQDGSTLLEEQLALILAKMEAETARHLIAQEKWARHWAAIQEQERRQKEQEQKQEAELSAFQKLLDEAHRWHQAQKLRAYLDAVEAHDISAVESASEHANWLRWARQKLDWYDPLVNGTDNLLNEVDKKTLTFPRKRNNSFG